MTRQLENKEEQRASSKRLQLEKALEHGIVDALESKGIILQGLAFKYDAWNCLMTIKAYIGSTRQVCFIGSDSVINCILKAYSDAKNDRLHWKVDKYYL
jgi:hypothetical protein